MPRRTLSPRITGGPAEQLSIPSLLTNVFYQSSTPGVCAMSRAADSRGNAAGDGAQAVERNSCTSGGIPHLFPSIAHCDVSSALTATVSAAIERARRFRARISEARIAEIDACAERDPRYVATDVLRASCAVRWLSLVIPRLFGGEGLDFGALIPALEEVSAGCVGVANLVAVHGLALMTVAATGDIRALERLCRELADSERSGVPALLSTAITEPQAGTDMENPVLLRKADIRNEAREVAGGYLLRGTKVFIRNGIFPKHMSMPLDGIQRDPHYCGACGSAAYRWGGSSKRAAGVSGSELIFDDCFVPTSARLGTGRSRFERSSSFSQRRGRE